MASEPPLMLRCTTDAVNTLFDRIITNLTTYCSSYFDKHLNPAITFKPINIPLTLATTVDSHGPFAQPTTIRPDTISRTYAAYLSNTTQLPYNYVHIILIKDNDDELHIHEIRRVFGFPCNLGMLPLFSNCKCNYFTIANSNLDNVSCPMITVLCTDYDTTSEQHWCRQIYYNDLLLFETYDNPTIEPYRLGFDLQFENIANTYYPHDLHYADADHKQDMKIIYRRFDTCVNAEINMDYHDAYNNKTEQYIGNYIPNDATDYNLGARGHWQFKLNSITLASDVTPTIDPTTTRAPSTRISYHGPLIERSANVGTTCTTEWYRHMFRTWRVVHESDQRYEEQYNSQLERTFCWTKTANKHSSVKLIIKVKQNKD